MTTAFLMPAQDPSIAGQSSNPIVVDVRQIGFTPFPFAAESFGRLEFRGGLELTSSAPEFGGLSSLAVSTDGNELLAVSDEGWWFKASLGYAGGKPVAIRNTILGPLVGTDGRRPRFKADRDAEAMCLSRPGVFAGNLYVGFESHPHLFRYDLKSGLPAPSPVRIPIPAALRKGPYNGEFESLGCLREGRKEGPFVAIAEDNFDSAGNIRAWIFGAGRAREFSIARYQDYKITDLTLLPDDDILTVERSFSPSSFPGMAIRRFSLGASEQGRPVLPELLFAGRQPFYAVDNMEGISAHYVGDELRISVISDDNYNHGRQRTLIYQFAIRQ